MDGDGSQRRQPDSKARRMLAQSTGMVYEQAFDELRKFVNYIMTAIENDATQEHVYELLEDLTGQIQDFYEIEYEHRRHVRDNHLQDHDHEFRRRADYLSGSRQHIRTYIDHRPATSSTQRPIVDAHAEVRKTMKSLQSEADRVRQKIQAISSALNKEKGQLDHATKSTVVTSSANVNNSATVPGQPATTVVPSAPLTPSAPPLTPSAPPPVQLLTPTAPATPKAPVKSLSTADLLSQLATAITESSEKKNRLPPMEPPIFDGNLLKFPTWLNSLEGLVETEAKSVPARLHYLGKYTTGPAFEAIAGYLGLQAGDSYDRAKAVLVSKYGNHMRIAEAFRVKLHDWPAIRRSDPIALGKYADFLWQCHAAMDSVGHLEFLNNSDENVKLTKKLPVFIADRWNRTIHRWQYGTEEDRQNDRVKGVYPPFKEFCMFVQEEARVAEGPCNFHQAESASSRGANKGVTNFATNAEPASQDVKQTTGKGFTPQCHYCRGAHFLNQCSAFIQQPPDAKKEYARANALCFGCLRRGHSCRDCPNRNPALMGDAQGNLVRAPRPAPRAGPSASVKQVIAGEQAMNSMIVLLRLRHQTDPEKHVLTYGILDTQSDACIIKEKLARQLGVEQEPVNLKLITMSRKSVVKSSVVHGLSVRGINEATELALPKCYTRAELPANRNNIPRFEEVYRWPHLRKVAAELPAYRDDIDVGILIGFNCSAALLPQECVYDNLHHPYGVRTALGWSVVGLVNPLTGPRGHETFCNQTSARDVTAADVKRLFDHEFQDLGDERTVSTEDSKFLAMMDREITQQEDGHYSLPLPLRDGHAPLPENRHIAERCLQSIGRKFKSNAQFKEHYCKFMNDMIARGHAEVAPPLTDEDKGRCNLVMHHGVYHPKKPGKLRAVFNISKEHLGVSLNGELMTGPDQINNLAGVLIRFRRKGIAITCDVKQMFYQVRVHERDRNLLRFLWFKDGDEDGEIIEYRMVVHPFGATSSPCIANYTFKKMARDHGADFDDTTVKFVLRDFYVDDGLTSVDTQGEALATIEQSHELCKRGGFWLQKFLCNDLDVMQAVPLELRVEQMQQLSLLCGQAGIERSLGVEWDIVHDAFQFRVTLNDKPLTRRSMLSCVSSVYDPLGLIAPILLTGRRLVQAVCRDGKSWDDPVPDEVRQEWMQWLRDLTELPTIVIPRCYRSSTTINLVKTELHHFCDASQVGYGTASYLRVIDDLGNVDTALVMGKSRVAPNKAVTIPRLELQSAVLATQVAAFVNREIEYDQVTNFYWTDSMITLGYLSNEARRFQIYVANRIQRIQSVTDASQWRHVATTQNPADISSRGATVLELKASRTWWRGPDFLSRRLLPEDLHEIDPVPDEDPEIKRKAIVRAMLAQPRALALQLAEKTSSWAALLRHLSVWIHYVRILQYRVTRKRQGEDIDSPCPVNVTDKHRAESLVIGDVQQEAFSEPLQLMKNYRYPDDTSQARSRKNAMKSSSNLFKLDVYVSEEGLLRVGGRVKRANVPRDIAQPLLLPRDHHVTELIVRHYHELAAHAGQGITLNNLRASGYWVIKGRATVTRYIHRCIVCKKLRGRPSEQLMSDLVQDQLTPAPPFSYCGVDFCGPFYIKQGRVTRKRWICVFVDLVIRAVHMEVCPSLSTDAFLHAYRRFVHRRGPIRVLRCDRGTNFVGARGEMEKAIGEMNHGQIKRELLEENCDWVDYKFNVPQASHMGGAWERLLGAGRRALEALLVDHSEKLDDDLMHTLVTEAESIMNCRPLTYVDVESPDALEPLSPQQLLTMKHKAVLPFPGHFVQEDLYCRRRWRTVQYLANQFWYRWQNEFLPTQQERRKWQQVQRNLEIDDIVMAIDKDMPRNQWKLARITGVLPSEDHLVRKAVIRTSTGTYERPIQRLVFLLRPRDHMEPETEN